MKEEVKARTRYSRFAMCAVVGCVAAAMVCVGSLAAADTYVDETRAHVGTDGQIYGVPFEGPDGNIVMPDMTRVRATNGNYGYISNDEMYAAILDNASNEEEKVQSIKNTANKKAPALASATEKYFGVAALTADELEECSRILITENGHSNALAAYSELAAEPLAVAINQGSLNRETAVALVSTYAKSADAATISQLSGDSEDSVQSYAESIVDNSVIEPVSAQQITVTQDVFDEVYKLAQQELAVPIPVYDEDGVTVVGTYMVNRM